MSCRERFERRGQTRDQEWENRLGPVHGDNCRYPIDELGGLRCRRQDGVSHGYLSSSAVALGSVFAVPLRATTTSW